MPTPENAGTDEASETEVSEPCPSENFATRDSDGFCTIHGWDCADFAIHLADTGENP